MEYNTSETYYDAYKQETLYKHNIRIHLLERLDFQYIFFIISIFYVFKASKKP